MKKLFVLLLAVLMVFGLTACSQLVALGNMIATDSTETTAAAQNPALVAYLENGGDTLLSSMEASFATSSGMTCTSTIEVVGNGFEIRININELEDLPEVSKTAMQAVYDGMESYWDQALTALQEEIPQVEYMTIYVCEKDGDVIATITMD